MRGTPASYSSPPSTPAPPPPDFLTLQVGTYIESNIMMTLWRYLQSVEEARPVEASEVGDQMEKTEVAF